MELPRGINMTVFKALDQTLVSFRGQPPGSNSMRSHLTRTSQASHPPSVLAQMQCSLKDLLLKLIRDRNANLHKPQC